MNLGDFFPVEVKKQFAERNIDLGNAILIKLPELSINYDKYIVVVAKDKHEVSVAYVIINSEANPNVAFTPYLKSLHVKIDYKNNKFLERDSFVDCSQLREFPVKTIVEFLTKHPERAVGNVSDEVLRSIHITISTATTIEKIVKQKFGF